VIIQELIRESLSPSFEWKRPLFFHSLMRFLFLLISSYGGRILIKLLRQKKGGTFDLSFTLVRAGTEPENKIKKYQIISCFII
jgi:hypothetical protein